MPVKGRKLTTDERKMLAAQSRKLATARKKENEVWQESLNLIRSIQGDGAQTKEIADAFGLSKARIYQLVSGKRSDAHDMAEVQARREDWLAERAEAEAEGNTFTATVDRVAG